MAIIEISSLQQQGLEVFSTLTEAQLRMELEPEKGLFIAESPKVIRVALDAGWEPTALLCERRHIGGDASDIGRGIMWTMPMSTHSIRGLRRRRSRSCRGRSLTEQMPGLVAAADGRIGKFPKSGIHPSRTAEARDLIPR